VKTLEKFLAGIVGIGLVTSLVLPGRQTPAVINSATKFVQLPLYTAITGKK
jgi:hypothetical protein